MQSRTPSLSDTPVDDGALLSNMTLLGPWKQRENKKEKSERERTDEERPWHFDPSGTYYAHSHPCTFSGHNSPHIIYIIPLHHFIHACICSCVYVYAAVYMYIPY